MIEEQAKISRYRCSRALRHQLREVGEWRKVFTTGKDATLVQLKDRQKLAPDGVLKPEGVESGAGNLNTGKWAPFENGWVNDHTPEQFQEILNEGIV